MKDDAGIRPQHFDDFIGQGRVKQVLRVAIAAARSRGEALDHVLLYGPPGLGKTTLAGIIAREMQANIKMTSAPTLDKGGVICALRGASPNDIIFVDEIHRLDTAIEELLYAPLEDRRLDLVFGNNLRSIGLRPFTLVGATTRAGDLSAPLRSRFGIALRLDFYAPSELAEIVKRSARILGVTIDDAASFEIGSRSRGTPRIANTLLKRARDIAEIRSVPVTLRIVQEVGSMLGIDGRGLDDLDRRLLGTIIRASRPVGLTAISAALNEHPEAIEEIHEPYLLQLGLLERTARGRVATALAHRIMSVPGPAFSSSF